jgi:hypothetical protein
MEKPFGRDERISEIKGKLEDQKKDGSTSFESRNTFKWPYSRQSLKRRICISDSFTVYTEAFQRNMLLRTSCSVNAYIRLLTRRLVTPAIFEVSISHALACPETTRASNTFGMVPERFRTLYVRFAGFAQHGGLCWTENNLTSVCCG